MSDALSSAVTAQAIAALKRENVQLHRSLGDAYRENSSLKRHLFHTSAVLDIAVNKLSAMGVSVDPPFDLRALRAEVKTMTPWTAEQPGAVDALDSQRKATQSAGEQTAMHRRFRLQTDIKDHTRAVQCAAFGPEDQLPWIASGGLDKRIVVSNFMTGMKHASIEYHEQNVSDVAWLSAGTLLSTSFDCTIKLCDVGSSQFKVPAFTAVTKGFALACCAVSEWNAPTTVFGACDSKRCLYFGDTRTGKIPFTWECETRANTVTYDPSSRALITGHVNGTIALWDVRKLRSGTASSGEAPSSLVSTSTSTPLDAHPLPLVEANPVTQAVQVAQEVPPKSPKHVSPDIAPTAGPVHPTLVPASAESPIAVYAWSNEVSNSSVLHVSYYGDRDESKKLLVVSEDNMARLYSRGVGFEQEPSLPQRADYQLESVLSGFQTRSYSVRGAYWRGQRDKRGASMFDDVDSEARHISECDMVICGGGETHAIVFDVTADTTGTAPLVMQRLDGHRGRVCGACVHRNASKPIVATFGEDASVRVWLPSK